MKPAFTCSVIKDCLLNDSPDGSDLSKYPPSVFVYWLSKVYKPASTRFCVAPACIPKEILWYLFLSNGTAYETDNKPCNTL